MKNNMIKKIYKRLALCLLLLPSADLFSQDINEVKIGEKVPDVYLASIVNYPKEEGWLMKDFGGKHLIIDFWYTYCAPCISGMPALDSLKREFSGKLNVLLSTFEPAQKIIPFWKGRHYTRGLELPSVCSDSVLKKLFPHRTAPHVVWIDDKGVVRAITGKDEVSRENVVKFLANEKLALKEKKDPENADVFSGKDPFLIIEDKLHNQANTRMYSYLGGYQENILGMLSPESAYEEIPGCMRIKAANMPLDLLYSWAYYSNRITTYHPKQIIKDFPDTLYKPDYDSHANLFCYDLIVRTNSKEKLRKIMQQDLDRYFGLKSSLARKRIKCYVISRKDLTDTGFLTKDTEHGKFDLFKKDGTRVIRNFKFSSLVEHSFFVDLPLPIVNETGLRREQVDMEIPLDVSDFSKLREAFRQCGLDISLEERYMEVILLEKY